MTSWADSPRLERIDCSYNADHSDYSFSTWPTIHLIHPQDLRTTAHALVKLAELKEDGTIPHLETGKEKP